MTDRHNYTVAAILVAVAVVGIGGLYFTTSGSNPAITGADVFQNATGTFSVNGQVNIAFKSFVDSNFILANITPQQTTFCNFLTANGTGDGTFANNSDNISQNLTPDATGCTVTYSTSSENGNSTGAFGVENLGNQDIRVNASDATGCAFGEAAPATCIRDIVANQQNVGDCNTTLASNYCIRTVGTTGTQEHIEYISFNSNTSPVTLCDNLDQNGGLEIDLNYTFAIAGVTNGTYVDTITFTADTAGVDAACDVAIP